MKGNEVSGGGREEVMEKSGTDKESNSKRRQDTLRLATCSDLRKSILLGLGEGEKVLSELRVELNVSSTTAIHALRDLEKDNLVFQDENKNYGLTKIGEVIALKLSDFVAAIEVLKRYEDFWLTHDLGGIPPHLMEKIGWLRNSTLVEATSFDTLKVYTNFIDILMNAKEIRGVTSMFVHEFHPLLKELTVEKNVDVELVLTKEILEGMDKKLLKTIFADKNSKLKLYGMEENIKVAFTVTDILISFGLFHFDGTYDWNNDLISHDTKAIEWGRELFEWYRTHAEEFIVDF